MRHSSSTNNCSPSCGVTRQMVGFDAGIGFERKKERKKKKRKCSFVLWATLEAEQPTNRFYPQFTYADLSGDVSSLCSVRISGFQSLDTLTMFNWIKHANRLLIFNSFHIVFPPVLRWPQLRHWRELYGVASESWTLLLMASRKWFPQESRFPLRPAVMSRKIFSNHSHQSHGPFLLLPSCGERQVFIA